MHAFIPAAPKFGLLADGAPSKPGPVHVVVFPDEVQNRSAAQIWMSWLPCASVAFAMTVTSPFEFELTNWVAPGGNETVRPSGRKKSTETEGGLESVLGIVTG